MISNSKVDDKIVDSISSGLGSTTLLDENVKPVAQLANDTVTAADDVGGDDGDDAQDASDRVLAYVEKIISLEPIVGADVIEIATVLGWRVIVKKGLYKPGDLVVYVEIDSVLPPWQYFINDKLDKCNFRIKTIKLRQQISQGYCIPIRELLNHPNKKLVPVYNVHGQEESGIKLVRHVLESGDVDYPLDIKSNMTGLIGIKKYVEHPGGGGGNIFKATLLGLKPFPSFIKKTDQPRIQNLPHYLTTYPNVEFEVTEKLEGSSVTIYHNKGVNGVCSRNFELNFEICTTQSEIKEVIIEKMKMFERLDGLKMNIALQGEFIGPKVQGNIYGMPELSWRCFDIYLIDQSRYATHKERVDIMDKLGLKWSQDGVPYIGTVTLEGKTLKDILEMANGFSLLKGGTKTKVLREGLVFKSTSLEYGNVITFKSISNQYLLKK